MSLLVLAYPELGRQDHDRIQEFRREHDGIFYEVVAPHFPLVFAVTGWTEADFIAEAAARAKGVAAFDVRLRSAVVIKDALSDYFHVILVPDEGFGRLVRLHDRLYADRLFPHRRLDIGFIPRLGVANSTDPLQCAGWAAEWNAGDFAIQGRIAALDVVRRLDGRVQPLERIPLSTDAPEPSVPA